VLAISSCRAAASYAGAGQRVHHAHVARFRAGAGEFPRVGCGDQVLEEGLRRARPRAFCLRAVALGLRIGQRRLCALALGARFDRHPGGADHAQHQGDQHRRGSAHRDAIAGDELADAVRLARRSRQHRLAGEEAADVGRELRHRGVAAVALALQRAQRDPVHLATQPARVRDRVGRHRALPLGATVATHGRHAPARRRDLGLAQDARQFELGGARQHLAGNRLLAGDEPVQHHAQRIDVGAGVDRLRVAHRLFRTHVGRGADRHAGHRRAGLGAPARIEALGDAEVDHLDQHLALVVGDQQVARLEVAVDDPFLVRVLDALADLQEQFEPVCEVHAAAVAELDQGQARHVLHREEQPALLGGADVQNLRDVRMLHAREQGAFAAETVEDVLAVHARLDHLQRDLAAYRLQLVGEVDRTHAARAELRGDAVRPEPAADQGEVRQRGRCGRRRRRGRRAARRRCRGRFQCPWRKARRGRRIGGRAGGRDRIARRCGAVLVVQCGHGGNRAGALASSRPRGIGRNLGRRDIVVKSPAGARSPCRHCPRIAVRPLWRASPSPC